MKRALIFATAYFPLIGGAEVAMKEMTDRLTDWEFDLVCARIRPGLASTERIGRVTVHRVGFGNAFDKYLLPLLGPLKALRIAKARDVSFIWALMASYGGFAALVYGWLRPHTKFLLNLQEGDPLEHYAKRVGRVGFLHRAIFRRADAIHAISRFLADWAVRMGARVTPEVIPNGVDVERFVRNTQHATRDIRSQTKLITTSRLSLKNGVDDLIRSLAFSPKEVELRIAGEGEDRGKLEALVAELGLKDRVTFLGLQPQGKLPELLHAADIFVRPALSEGLGISYLEAMAAGLPIVGTPVGGIPDFLKDGETGVFCQPRDPASIAQAVERIRTEPGLRERLIANGERLVRERYDWKTVMRKLDMLFRSFAETPSPRAYFSIGFFLVFIVTLGMFAGLARRSVNLMFLADPPVRAWAKTVLEDYRAKTGLGLSSFDVIAVWQPWAEVERYMLVRDRYHGPFATRPSRLIQFSYIPGSAANPDGTIRDATVNHVYEVDEK